MSGPGEPHATAARSLVEQLRELDAKSKGSFDATAFFSGLPSESTADFQLLLTRYVELRGLKVCSEAERVLKDSAVSLAIRYAAFVALATYFRRVKDVSRSGALFAVYRAEFGEQKSFALFESLHLMVSGGRDALRDAYRLTSQCMASLPGHTGVAAAHADIVCYCWDMGIIVDRQTLDECSDLMRAAMRARPDYARYPFLLGKLLVRLLRFDDAEMMILRSIDLEDSSRPTYPIRIGEYQLEHLRLRLIQSDNKIAESVRAHDAQLANFQEELRSTLSAARSESILLLGLFAGILGVAVSTVQLTTRMAPLSSGLLIVTMAGALITAYASLAITISRGVDPWRPAAAMLAGCTIVLTALIFLAKAPAYSENAGRSTDESVVRSTSARRIDSLINQRRDSAAAGVTIPQQGEPGVRRDGAPPIPKR